MRKKLGIGIVGAGHIGTKRASTIGEHADTQLMAVADLDSGRAKALSDKFGGTICPSWESLIARPDIDVVVVSVMNNALKKVAIGALNAGKHVLCEKPLGRNAEEAAEIVHAAVKSGVFLKTGFNHRFHRAIWKAKELFDDGAVGRITFMRGRYGHGGRLGYEKEWRADPEISGGGELLDQGSHMMDLFRWFLNDFDEIFSYTTTAFWSMPVEDNAFCLLRTKGGQIASLHASCTQWKNLFSLEIFGDKGYLVVSGLGGSYGVERLVVGKRKQEFGKPDERILEFPGDDNSWTKEWEEFVSAIQQGRAPLGDGIDGLEANRLIAAAYQSNKLGETVKISRKDA